MTVGAFRGFSQSISRQQFHDDSPHWAKEEFAHESMKLFLLLTRKYKSNRYAYTSAAAQKIIEEQKKKEYPKYWDQ